MQPTISVTESHAEISSTNDDATWPALASACILFALNGRGAWFASDTARATDLAWTREEQFLESGPVYLTDGDCYELRFNPHPSPAMLRKFMLSSDSSWDSVFIIPLVLSEREKVVELLETIDVRMPHSSSEALATTGDGTGLLWLAHGRPIDEVKRGLNELVTS